MRNGLLAIVLVAASFAGGAAVNGPGFRWAQTLIQGRLLGGIDLVETPPAGHPPGAESPSATPQVSPTGTATAQAMSGPADAGEMRADPVPEPEAPALPPEARASGPAAQAPEPRGAAAPARPAAALVTPSGPRESLPLDAPALEPPAALVTPRDREDDPKGRPGGGEAQDPPQPQAAATPEEAVPPPPPERPRALDPAASRTALPSRPPGPGATAKGAAAGWGEIRRKMRELGVARYGIEGEPAGKVRFHCVIPLAGQRAVGQQFEAEGDDEIQAAQAALRRVSLWRATEAPAP